MSASLYSTRNPNELPTILRLEALKGLYTGTPWAIDLTSDMPIKEDPKRKYYIRGVSEPIVGFSQRGMGKSIGKFVNGLVMAFCAFARHIDKIADADKMLELATGAYKKGMSMAWETAQHYDGEKRAEAIQRCLNDARAEGRYIWLCSSHGDPAKGHEPWQGKYYYDEEAPEYVIQWAKSHGLKSYQWVIGEPVWMLTRPNCRHYMASLSYDYAKYTEPEMATVIMGMFEDIGKRGLNQTLEGGLDYDTRIMEYKYRLEFHTEAYRERPSEKLAGLIAKDKLLISQLK